MVNGSSRVMVLGEIVSGDLVVPCSSLEEMAVGVQMGLLHKVDGCRSARAGLAGGRCMLLPPHLHQ